MASETLVYKALYNLYKTIILYIPISSIRVGDEGLVVKNKKLTLSGIAGVLVACLIIAAVSFNPWVMEPTSSDHGFPHFEPPPGAPPLGSLTLSLFISNFTEPIGIDSEAIVTVVVTSKCNMSGVTLTLDLVSPCEPPCGPLGVTVVEGNLSSWTGDLMANISAIFNVRLKIVEEGYARIWAKSSWWYDGWLGYNASDSIWILIHEGNVQISREPITPPGYLEAEPTNGTLPLWPNGTSYIP